MVEFKRIISTSEVKTTYLNLTDIEKNTFGKYFPVAGTSLCIIDEKGDEYNATKHGNNQIWGNIRQWFILKKVEAGTLIKVSYNETEQKDNKPIIRIEILEPSYPKITEVDAIDDENQIAEISFEFEKQLESFLSDNLTSIERDLTIYTDSNGNTGRQYPTDVGIIDLLCLDKENNFVVIELKKKRTSDVVVGQVLRYMGWVNQNLNKNKQIRGLVITPEVDERLEYAASMVPNITVKYYKVKIEFVTKEAIRKD